VKVVRWAYTPRNDYTYIYRSNESDPSTQIEYDYDNIPQGYSIVEYAGSYLETEKLNGVVVEESSGDGVSHQDFTLDIYNKDLSAESGFVSFGYAARNDKGGAQFSATGTTTLAKAGTFDRPNGLIYDSVGTEFSYDGLNINILAFGGKSDLTTDNNSVITDCIAFAKNRSTYGQSIYFPPIGSGYLTSQVSFDNVKGVIVHGDNARVKIRSTGTDNYIFNVTNSTECEFKDILYTGNSDTTATYSNSNRKAGIGIFTSSFIKVHDNVFEKFASFGIFAQNLSGATYQEGLTITRNIFRDFPYDSATPYQCGVLLSDNSEYSAIEGNSFYEIPGAARFDDGANSTFENNTVMKLNSEYRTDAAGVYQESNSNSGKLKVINNNFNHNETGQIVLFLKNDAAKPQNACIVEGNHFLENGSVSHSLMVAIQDFPHARIVNNHFRPSFNVTGEASLKLSRCNKALVDQCMFDDGDYAIHVNAETVRIGDNTYTSQATGKLLTESGGEIEVNKNRSYSFRISAAGTKGSPWGDDSVSVTRAATGRYTLNHSFGSTNYTLAPLTDNDNNAPKRNYSVVRAATTANIYISDGNGADINDDFLLTINHGIDSEYAM